MAVFVELDITVTKETKYKFRFLLQRVEGAEHDNDTDFPPPNIPLTVDANMIPDDDTRVTNPNGKPKATSRVLFWWFPVVYSSFLQSLRTYAVYEERVKIVESEQQRFLQCLFVRNGQGQGQVGG